MTLPMTRAWILLSIPNEGGDLISILWRADGINKAIPTAVELNDGLGWLRTADLIKINGAIYSKTESGNNLIVQCDQKSKSIFDLWDKISESLESIPISEFELEKLSETEVEVAYKKYHKEFRETYEKLKKEDI